MEWFWASLLFDETLTAIVAERAAKRTVMCLSYRERVSATEPHGQIVIPLFW
jgi:hypothetical protein